MCYLSDSDKSIDANGDQPITKLPTNSATSAINENP